MQALLDLVVGDDLRRVAQCEAVIFGDDQYGLVFAELSIPEADKLPGPHPFFFPIKDSSSVFDGRHSLAYDNLGFGIVGVAVDFQDPPWVLLQPGPGAIRRDVLYDTAFGQPPGDLVFEGILQIHQHSVFAGGSVVPGAGGFAKDAGAPEQCDFRIGSIAGWFVVAAWIAVTWTAAFSGSKGRLISDGQHVSAWGRAPIYDDRTADWLMERFPRERTFTTIESGSYCLLRWGFQKPVFLDGFFAPHPKAAWNSYNEAFETGNPAPLHQKFGVTTALIPTTSEGWFQIFLRSEDWYPAAVGKGAVVFLHRSIPLPASGPEIFFTPTEMMSTSAFYRNNTMRVLFQSIADPDGFPEKSWTAHPKYEALKNLAVRIYQRVE